VTPKDGPRDWDKELADIDKLIAANPAAAPLPAKAGKGGPAPAHGERRASRVGPSVSGGSGRRESLASVIWFLLATLLGVGLTFLWPYTRGCGTGLYAYLSSIGAFTLASTWSIIWSWRTRRASVHFLSIVLLGWSAFLAMREILPRVGYARVHANWTCPSPPTASD